MDADNSQPYFMFFIPWIFLQSRHQQTHALNKVEFVTGSNPLHVWAPWCHPQAFFQIKGMQPQNVNLGVHSPHWNDSIVKILQYTQLLIQFRGYIRMPLGPVVSYMNPIKALSCHLLQTRFNIILPYMPNSFKWFLPSGLPTKSLHALTSSIVIWLMYLWCCISRLTTEDIKYTNTTALFHPNLYAFFSLCMPHVPHISSYLFWLPWYFVWMLQVVQFSPVSCHFLPLRPKYLPQHPILENP